MSRHEADQTVTSRIREYQAWRNYQAPLAISPSPGFGKHRDNSEQVTA